LNTGPEHAGCLLAQTAAAMTAVIVECADFAVAVTQHDHAFAIQLEQEVAAGFLQLRDVSDQQPGAQEYPLALRPKDFFRNEIIASERVLAEGRT